jgi:hypothetical protein
MEYAISYKPRRNREKPWLLKIWEPVPEPILPHKRTASYLYKVQYWLRSQAEVEATLAEYQQVYG